MQHRPLNATTPFEPWPHFDPGVWIDFNPSLVQLPDGRRHAVIRRDRVPPVPGKGTVWAVEVDALLRPAGQPFALIADGEDPRAVVVGGRVLVFYVLFERDPPDAAHAHGRITGTSMVLAEFDPTATPWRPLGHFRLPKYPLGGAPPGGNPGWEKNWVPFVISATQVGLIYSHDPWQVIVLNVDPASGSERRFEQAWRADGLHWPWGGIRGGTPPVPYARDEWITFFHSSEVVGSRKCYMVGACTLQARPPHAPLRMTQQPLLVAPYKGGMHRHGWPVAASVIFPLGCQVEGGSSNGGSGDGDGSDEGGFRLLCGLDDGEIAPYLVPRQALQQRLAPLTTATTGVGDVTGAALRSPGPLLLQPPGAPPHDLPLLRFLQLAASEGGTLLDVGSDAGLFMAGLAAGYRNVEAVATDASAADWRARAAALNGMRHVSVHLPRGISGVQSPAVARAPWPLEALDEAGFAALDLLVIGGVADVPAVLQGMRHTLARDRPAVLIQMPAMHEAHVAAVASLLQAMSYQPRSIFPRSGATLWCAGVLKVAADWFVEQ